MSPTLRLHPAQCKTRGILFLEFFILLTLALVAIGMALPYFRGAELAKNESKALRHLQQIAAFYREDPQHAAWRDASFASLLSTEKDPSRWEGASLFQEKLLIWDGYLFQAHSGVDGLWIYAWPVDYGKTGNAAFCFQSPQQIFETRNARRQYRGTRRKPQEKAAAVAIPKEGWHMGKDTQEWRLVAQK